MVNGDILLFLAAIALSVVFGIRIAVTAIGAAYRFGVHSVQYDNDIAAVVRDKDVNDAAAMAIEGEERELAL